MHADAVTQALCEVKFAKLSVSILIQDSRIDQSGSIQDQASTAGLVLKQAHASTRLSINPRNQDLIHISRSQISSNSFHFQSSTIAFSKLQFRE
jgi:hypothetical protein